MTGLRVELAEDLRIIGRAFCSCCPLRKCSTLMVPASIEIFLLATCCILQTTGTFMSGNVSKCEWNVHDFENPTAIPPGECSFEVVDVYYLNVASSILYVYLLCLAVFSYVRTVRFGRGGMEAWGLCNVCCLPILSIIPAGLSIAGCVLSYSYVFKGYRYSMYGAFCLCLSSGILAILAYFISIVGYICVKTNRKERIDITGEGTGTGNDEVSGKCLEKSPLLSNQTSR
ncbi:uncharacterized protein LOC123541687 isoform X5 [Mercenaria mercenaria]|uniref:uncharacterized protein LOC123541687 isoform X5 n=1 Tax=Mercenaria mercenaria TaxID=6596 RepID=UPI00234FAC68|nr:uncharacterized protein LOC123541687 isoform X5 [Mercenaria mercenaria]XP_053387792.1 uncharacterized protein LOC123541687 isoform X5 [Mercenaria mercenaria]